jgi:3-phosphoshikimate 1-carboxyvinyltransferase
MNLKISTDSQRTIETGSLNITGSKSETNRLLLLQVVFKYNFRKYFNSDDSEVMSKALANSQLTIDNSHYRHHAGTMRFLTAYFQQGRK